MANMRGEPTRDEPPEVQQDGRRILIRRKLGGDFLERREKVPVRGLVLPLHGAPVSLHDIFLVAEIDQR
jgi:hypothetical protein